jgi:hypothetical protein
MPPAKRPKRVQVDSLDQAGMNHGGPYHDVIEQRDAHAVEEVADVAGRGAAHVEERQARRDRRHARQGLDRPERIAERARHLPHLLA